ncbi:MAG: SUMF1/EgtB/PvdO family nonheme iron enzyme [Luteolibacter sp.]
MSLLLKTQMDHTLGDYQLKELISQTPEKRTWLAEQTTIGRFVLIDELTDHRPHHHAAFLARARAMAAVDFPKIGTVLEAVDEPGASYYAYELLPGSSLTRFQLSGQTFQAETLVPILRQTAEANLHLEASGLSTTQLTLSDIHLEASGIVRLKNLAIPGPRNPEQSIRDITHLGDKLRDLLARDWPGTNRVLTLLGWMRGEGLETPITWQQVLTTCQQITSQLSGPHPPVKPPLNLRRWLFPVIALVSLVGLAVLGHYAWKHIPRPQKVTLPASITLPAGTYTTPDGLKQPLAAVTLQGHLVTHRQYLDFLEILEILAKDGDQKLFDHPEQPATKSHHLPDGWESIKSELQSSPASLLRDQAITGIDWWDAYAYSRWKKSRLPTQEELFAAGEKLPASPLYEWTELPATDPANPLAEKRWVLFSPHQPREWLNYRSIRRQNVGFRVVE